MHRPSDPLSPALRYLRSVEGRVASDDEVKGQGATMEEWDVESLRRQFPQTTSVVYLNTGTVGLCPLPVVEALLDQTRAFEMAGQLGWGPAETAMNAARARLAARLGARADDLVLTRNATDGTNMVATGIDWRPGDEVLL